MHTPVAGDIGEKRRHVEIPDEEPLRVPAPAEPQPSDKGFRVMVAEIVAIKFSGGVAPQVRDRIRMMYPDVAIFKSLHAMLSEYPTTADNLEYLPEADDDYWTKPAA